MRRVPVVAVSSLLVVSSLVASRAVAETPAPARSDASGPSAQPGDTFTWWCTDVSRVLHVDVPVILGRAALVAPDPAPIPVVCPVAFPVAVPSGSAFASGAAWITNTTYPPPLRAALAEEGYDFRSDSPAADFMSKLVEVRVEVRDFSDDGSGVPVAVSRADPRQAFRLTQERALTGPLPLAPIVDPALGLDLSPEEHARLPELSFPIVAGPVPPGHYRLWAWFTLSEAHDDGLGLADHFLVAGDNLVAFPPFFVLPP